MSGKVIGGEWDGSSCIGCSLAIGPSGEILIKAYTMENKRKNY